MSGDFIPPSRKLYLTPDAPVEGRFCRQLSIPDTPEWVGLVDGLLSTFAEPETWRQFGDLTPEQTAEAFLAILLESWALDGCGVAGDVPTPFWDDAENSDDQLAPLEQIWYGIVDGNFIEDIDIWTIAGFIAYSGQIGAAISFVTLAKKFKLAWKTGDIGGVIRVFIDGADVGTVDTYSAAPGIVEREYTADPEEDEHPILMVLESVPATFTAQQVDANVEAPMMVVRKRLNADEVGSPDLRYNPTTDQVEFFNGETWTPAPNADPRSSDQFRLPPISGSSARCNAAERMVAQVEQQVNQAIQFQSTAGIASAFLFGLGLLTVGISTLVGLFLLVADTMLSIGFAAIINAMTSEVYDDLKCILFNHLDDNGQLANSELAGVRSDVDTHIGGVAAVVVNLMFDAFGAVNLSNAGVVRTEVGDCECGVIEIVTPPGYGTLSYLGSSTWQIVADSFNDGGTTRWRTSAHREDYSAPCASAPPYLARWINPGSGYHYTNYIDTGTCSPHPNQLPPPNTPIQYFYLARNSPFTVTFQAYAP